jgi:non-specific serine/threonine protein kinase
MTRRFHSSSPRKTRASQFAAALAEALHQLELTHQDLASSLNVTRYAVDSWTRAANPTLPTSHNLEQLCYLLEQRQAGLGERLAGLAGSEWLPPRPQIPIPTPATSMPPALRVPPTSFVGRERDLAEIQQTFRITRLITLTGTGGIGKTRLAQRLATELITEFADGVRVVELARLNAAALVSYAVAAAFSLLEKSDQALLDTLTAYLKDKHLLLIIDNCEHLVAACRSLIAHLLRHCPQLHILTTSREALRLAGEAAWPVSPLSLPKPPGTSPSSGGIPLKRPQQYEAVRLFIERAFFTQQGFVLTPQNSAAIVKICQRLDGLPLAIELAAAHTRNLPIEAIAQRLDDRFQWLTRDQRDPVQSQHQTLRAALDWSYDLLSPPERVLFKRLSVFAGQWTLEAAEAICGAEGSLAELHQHLSEKSLIHVERAGATTHYRMLETIKVYASEQLRASAEATILQQRHAHYFLSLAERAEPELMGAQQATWLQQLADAHDNLRAALDWALARSTDFSRYSTATDVAPTRSLDELALRCCAALWRFWQVRGHLSEGRARLAEALARTQATPPTLWRAAALNGAGVLARQQGDYESARALYQESLELYRALADQKGVATVLNDLGIIATAQNDYAWARRLYEESLLIWRTLGHKQGIATSLIRLGIVAFWQGDHETTRALCEASLVISRELNDQVGIILSLNGLGEVARAQGDYALAGNYYQDSLRLSHDIGHKWGIAAALHNLGYVAHHQGDYTQAAAHFSESLPLYQELGDRRGVSECLVGLAGVYSMTGKPEHAARLFGSANALLATLSAPLSPNDSHEYERNLQLTRAQLPSSAFDTAWREGEGMEIERAMQYAVEVGD